MHLLEVIEHLERSTIKSRTLGKFDIGESVTSHRPIKKQHHQSGADCRTRPSIT